MLAKMDSFSREAHAIAKKAFGEQVEIYEGVVGDARPQALLIEGDILISFLSPWIVTVQELSCFNRAINFHPGSTDYPGTGCYNFALYEGASEYGAVCHHMLQKVDTGDVIAETRFPVAADETVETLKLTTMTAMLEMYESLVARIADGDPLPSAPQHWTRRAFLKREMDALKICDCTMPDDEIARRVRATVYPGYPGPVMRHADGSETMFAVPERPALA